MTTVPPALVIDLTKMKLAILEMRKDIMHKKGDPLLTKREIGLYADLLSGFSIAEENLVSLIDTFILGMDGGRE